jgi:methyl-accepting chemotaxis protein
VALRNTSGSRSGGIAFKLGLAQLVTAAIAVVAVVALAVVYRVTDAHLARSQAQTETQMELAAKLDTVRKNIAYDLVQVQQYLTDVSATRLVDGVGADAWQYAAKYADAFGKDLAAAREVAVTIGDSTLVTELDRMAVQFPAHFENGQAMARAYIKDGPLSGNAAMAEFDRSTEAMTDAIKIADDRIAAIRSRTAIEREAVKDLRAAAAHRMATLGVILAVLVAAVSIIVLRYVNRGLIRPLTHATEVLDEMARGKQDAAIESFDAGGEMSRLVEALLAVRRTTRESYQAERAAEKMVVAAIGSGLHALAKGDLTYRISEELSDAFVGLRDDFNAAASHLNEAMRSVSGTTGEVSTGAGDISQWTDDLARRTERQAASLEETAATLQEISASVDRSASHAKEARAVVAGAKVSAEKVGDVVGSAVAAMQEIEASSKKISDIVVVIDEIAFQTNLLALNAGVEAARAGETGKGFAVVASEVRALALRCATAAHEVKALISESQQHVALGVSLVGNSGAALTEILDQVGRINTLVEDMARASEQQSAGIKQISSAVSDMDGVTQKNAVMVQQNKEVARALTEDTGALSSMIALFDVGATARGSGEPVRRRSAA